MNLDAGTVLVQSNVNDLGVLTDSTRSTRDHICAPSVSDFVLPASPDSCNPENLSRVWLPIEALVHALISSRLDYCNSLLNGINQSLLDKLQAVLSAAARLVLKKLEFDNIFQMTFVTSCTGYLSSRGSASKSACMYARVSSP